MGDEMILDATDSVTWSNHDETYPLHLYDEEGVYGYLTREAALNLWRFLSAHIVDIHDEG